MPDLTATEYELVSRSWHWKEYPFWPVWRFDHERQNNFSFRLSINTTHE